MGHRATFTTSVRTADLGAVLGDLARTAQRFGLSALAYVLEWSAYYGTSVTVPAVLLNSADGLREKQCSYARSCSFKPAIFSSWNSFFMRALIFRNGQPRTLLVRKFNLCGSEAVPGGLTICGNRTFCP